MLTSPGCPETVKLAKIFFGLIILISSPGFAQARAHHHPWLMRGSTTSAPVLEVSSRHVRSSDGSKLVHDAYKYKGIKYKFGGTTRKGLDCSGLVTRVYNDLKLGKVPRSSAALYKHGHPVKLNDLRAGDLVFFKNTYKPGISHVGIYTGNDKFIHARNRKFGVTVSSLSDPYFQIHYAGARRLY
jgi:cell wall-associated NlpC family hydrolase